MAPAAWGRQQQGGTRVRQAHAVRIACVCMPSALCRLPAPDRLAEGRQHADALHPLASRAVVCQNAAAPHRQAGQLKQEEAGSAAAGQWVAAVLQALRPLCHPPLQNNLHPPRRSKLLHGVPRAVRHLHALGSSRSARWLTRGARQEAGPSMQSVEALLVQGCRPAAHLGAWRQGQHPHVLCEHQSQPAAQGKGKQIELAAAGNCHAASRVSPASHTTCPKAQPWLRAAAGRSGTARALTTGLAGVGRCRLGWAAQSACQPAAPPAAPSRTSNDALWGGGMQEAASTPRAGPALAPCEQFHAWMPHARQGTLHASWRCAVCSPR